MNKTVSISGLRMGQKIENEAFALRDFEKKVSRQDKPYYNVRLGDKSGEIRGKIWAESMDNVDSEARVGDIVSVSGLIQEYSGKPQLIISSLEVVESMAPEEFLPVTTRDRDQMIDDIEKEIGKIRNKYLKKLLDLFWKDETNREKFINFPAGEYVHHGYVGGLLEHTWEMLVLSKPYFDLYPMMDKDLFFTGLFFHDIGKLEDLDIVGSAIIRTTSGRLVDHIGQGIIIVDRLSREIDGFPEDLKHKLFHMILSHQGDKEYGSPIVPQTIEAMVLHYVDLSSAHMNQAIKHIEKETQTGKEFTEYHKWMRRSFYQKDYLKENE